MAFSYSTDWLVFYATAREGDLLLEQFNGVDVYRIHGLELCSGRLSIQPTPGQAGPRSRRVILVKTGLGQANAAYAAGAALMAIKARRVLSFGVAGGYKTDGWRIGQTACGCAFGLGDEGVVGSGWRDLSAIGIPLLPRRTAAAKARPYNLIAPPMEPLPAAAKSFFALDLIRMAGILTVVGCSGSPARAREMRRRASLLTPETKLPWVEDMETAAIALACARAKKPLLALRGISNFCGDRNKGNWNIPVAVKVVTQAAYRVLTAPSLPPGRPGQVVR